MSHIIMGKSSGFWELFSGFGAESWKKAKNDWMGTLECLDGEGFMRVGSSGIALPCQSYG
jgi:hypothetical protein